MNRGPDSLGTLRLLKSLGAGGVLGNHDIHLIRVTAGARALTGKDTFVDVLEAEDRDELVRWLRARPLVRVWDDATLVHAGVNPAWGDDPAPVLAGRDPLQPDEDVRFATLVRHCTRDGLRPPSDDPPPHGPYRPWFHHWRERAHRTFVFGHWARAGLVVEPGIRGLDTGCVWGGRLTAWIAEEDRLVQVSAAAQYARPGR